MIEFGKWGPKHLEFICNPIQQDARINILDGSVRSGKTVAMIPKWLTYIEQGPPGLLLMTGVSKDTLYDNVLNDLFDTVGQENYTYNRQTGDLVLFGRKIKVIGAKDEGSEKYLRGKTLAGAYCDEVSLMPERFFNQLLNRMSVAGSKLYATTNPDTPFHYLYKNFLTDENKLASGMVKRYHMLLDDNPNLDPEYLNFIKGAYTGMWYKRMIEGQWVNAEGLIYDSFNESMEYETLPEWDYPVDHFIAIDYGTTNPMVFLDIVDTGDIVYVDREYYWNSRTEQRQKSDNEYLQDLFKFMGNAEKYTAVIIDPSAASFIALLRQNGVVVIEADNSVLDGIRLMSTMFNLGKLKVAKSCTNFRQELSVYQWDETSALKGIEKPVKANDHACDACRYFCKTIVQEWRMPSL